MMTPYPPCPGRRLKTPVHLPGGCRCMVDAKPTLEIVKALMGMGYSLQKQGEMIDPTTTRPYNFARILERRRVTRGMARRVVNLIDRVWDKPPGPSTRAVNHAAKMGWKIVDPEVVKRLIAGFDDCPHNKIERGIAARFLARSNDSLTVNAIAVHLRANFQSVREDLIRAA